MRIDTKTRKILTATLYILMLATVLLPKKAMATRYDPPYDVGYTAQGSCSEGATRMGKTDSTVGYLWARTVADSGGWANIYSRIYDEGIPLEDSPYMISVYGWLGGSLQDSGDDETGMADVKVSLWVFDETSQETVVYETIISRQAVDQNLIIDEDISWQTTWRASSGQYTIGVELWSHAGGGTDSAESDFYNDGYLLFDYYDVSQSSAGGFNFGRFRPLIGELVIPRTIEIQKGENVELAFDIDSYSYGITDVQLDLYGLPYGAAYEFSSNPISLAPNETVTTYLRITNLPDPQDILPLTLTATGLDGISHSTSICISFREDRADLNKDGIVNILDITIVAKAFNSKPGDPNWDASVDLNDDRTINILDITLVAKDYGKTY